MFEIPMKQATDHMKSKKKEDQSADALVLLRSWNKIFMRGRGEGMGKRGGRIRYRRRLERSTECQEILRKYVKVKDRELGIATRKSQMLEKQEVLRTQWGCD